MRATVGRLRSSLHLHSRPSAWRRSSNDIKKLQHFWSDEGIKAGPYKNGGSNPVHGLSGVGGPTTSIDLYADPTGYTIEGFSVCTVGDAAEMQGNGE